MGRQTGTTKRGNSFVLSQWAPNVLQLTLQSGNYVISETLENIRSEQEMIERKTALEDEFIEWVTRRTQLTENTDEVTS
jgi:hypothetical protein